MNLPHLESPARGNSRAASRQVARTIAAILAVTVLAVFATWLKFQVEQKYIKLERMAEENRNLGEKISQLEADVEGLMSYERIDEVLRANNIEVYPPERAFNIKLTGEYEPVANAERRGISPRGKI